MFRRIEHPVLLIGGSGVVGEKAARTLRRLYPELPLAIGGRDMAKATAIAQALGKAEATRVELGKAGLGLESQSFSAVVTFLKDDTLSSLRYAQQQGVAHLGISTAAFEIAPEVALHINAPKRSAILMMSNWLAGSATLPLLHLVRDFATVRSIRIAAVLDEQDMGGPAAHADYDRQTGAVTSALMRESGKWLWVQGESARRTFTMLDGTPVTGTAFGNLDLLSMMGATDVESIRFDFALGETSSRRRGEPFSTEILLEVSGQERNGSPRRVRQGIVHPAGQAPLTALGVALGVERLLGLDGAAPVAPGLYLPNSLLDPAYFVQRMQEFGARFHDLEPEVGP
ncbi:NAD(P)-dependent oxidoreductase [Billgrantia kenyensis]|uniref:NAD(P)-dependent oxidoreductase n=1 Tax=Billgrantia kenyensis TaxID=321266 RepID=A0A7V9W4E0_9GAMM|nr:NAD(P)-dependent oxidoreductase [Halomonas kenyensis]MBA2780794.1 NAD(P)-dependent oxidoreductase [Halomonas kenyensis]MCG6663619.1 NAD(P)-dependent oxidoreductase [Halomonas kenyensis]